MVESGDRPRFVNETTGQRVAGASAGRDELDRHVAPQGEVAGEVDIAHPARAEETAEAIPSESDVTGLDVHVWERAIIVTFSPVKMMRIQPKGTLESDLSAVPFPGGLRAG
jgi:hypothetical protein